MDGRTDWLVGWSDGFVRPQQQLLLLQITVALIGGHICCQGGQIGGAAPTMGVLLCAVLDGCLQHHHIWKGMSMQVQQAGITAAALHQRSGHAYFMAIELLCCLDEPRCHVNCVCAVLDLWLFKAGFVKIIIGLGGTACMIW